MLTALKVSEKSIPLVAESGHLDQEKLRHIMYHYRCSYYLLRDSEKIDVNYWTEDYFKKHYKFVDKELEDQFAEVVRLWPLP